MPDSLSSEFRLLLACALPPADATDIERLRQAVSDCTDWAAFIKLVRRQQLTPLVGHHLQQYAADLVPSGVLAQLGEFYAANQQRTALLLLELAALGRAFAPANIPLCPLKGPWLAQRLYGSPSMRLSSDLDLLVAPEVVLTAEAALLAHGYQRTEPAIALSSGQWRMYRQIIHHSSYQHPKRKLHIELHWGITTPDMLPLCVTTQVLERAHPENFAGQRVLDLSSEDLLSFLLIHGARHCWSQLKWLADIAVLLRNTPTLDWQVVQHRLLDYGLEGTFILGLLLCQRWFELPLPPDLESCTQDKIIVQLVDEASRAIIKPLNDRLHEGQLNRIKNTWYWAKLTPSWRKKIHLLWHTWFIHYDWIEFPLPDWLFPLYIFLRPFLWLRRYHWPRRAK